MIVVSSRLDVYGPFRDANEAMEWISSVRELVRVDSLPLVMHIVTGPERFGDRWKRRPRTVDGKPMTMEQMDAQMNYKPPGAK